MPATKNGIYHNLRESKYTVSNVETVLFFSSKLYRDKFLTGYEDHREMFKKRFDKLMENHPYNVNMLADIHLYNKIEKRGFFVRIRGAKVSWHDLHLYALGKMTARNTLDWSKTQKQK